MQGARLLFRHSQTLSDTLSPLCKHTFQVCLCAHMVKRLLSIQHNDSRAAGLQTKNQASAVYFLNINISLFAHGSLYVCRVQTKVRSSPLAPAITLTRSRRMQPVGFELQRKTSDASKSWPQRRESVKKKDCSSLFFKGLRHP